MARSFRTENKNVIFTVDATAIPPIYNQDDAQLVKGVTLGAMGRITDRWEVLANIGYLDSELQTQNSVNNGRRLTLTPEWSSSFWTTISIPDWRVDRRRHPPHRRRCGSMRRIRSSRRAITSSTRWPSTPSTRISACG